MIAVAAVVVAALLGVAALVLRRWRRPGAPPLAVLRPEPVAPELHSAIGAGGRTAYIERLWSEYGACRRQAGEPPIAREEFAALLLQCERYARRAHRARRPVFRVRICDGGVVLVPCCRE